MNLIKGFFKKILENLASVKIWLFLLPFWISSFFMYKVLAYMIISKTVDYVVLNTMFTAWTTFNITLVGTIIAAREVFKVAKIKLTDDKENKNISV